MVEANPEHPPTKEEEAIIKTEELQAEPAKKKKKNKKKKSKTEADTAEITEPAEETKEHDLKPTDGEVAKTDEASESEEEKDATKKKKKKKKKTKATGAITIPTGSVMGTRLQDNSHFVNLGSWEAGDWKQTEPPMIPVT
jgi:hypothetical protein